MSPIESRLPRLFRNRARLASNGRSDPRKSCANTLLSVYDFGKITTATVANAPGSMLNTPVELTTSGSVVQIKVGVGYALGTHGIGDVRLGRRGSPEQAGKRAGGSADGADDDSRYVVGEADHGNLLGQVAEPFGDPYGVLCISYAN